MLIILEPLVRRNRKPWDNVPFPGPPKRQVIFHCPFPARLLLLLFIQGFQKLSSIIWEAVGLSTIKHSTLASISCLKIFPWPVFFNNQRELQREACCYSHSRPTCQISSLISKNSIINFKDLNKECSSLFFCLSPSSIPTR